MYFEAVSCVCKKDRSAYVYEYVFVFMVCGCVLIYNFVEDVSCTPVRRECVCVCVCVCTAVHVECDVCVQFLQCSLIFHVHV